MLIKKKKTQKKKIGMTRRRRKDQIRIFNLFFPLSLPCPVCVLAVSNY